MASAFVLQVPRDQCNKRFLIVAEDDSHRCTRLLIDDLLSRFTDKDGEFVKRLQTTEFEARLWELYLFACFEEAEVPLAHDHNRPDFSGMRDGRRFFIEAVTTNPPPSGASPTSNARVEGDQSAAADSHMLRVMKAVLQKVGKEYEKLPWVAGNPLAIAVAPFHGPTALHFTDSVLQQYLWGIEPREETDANTGATVRKLVKLDKRSIGGRDVDFGWFDTAESAPVSAVIYSIAATAGKFHRMAVEKGLASNDPVALVHAGVAYDPDPAAFKPRPFAYVVEPTNDGEFWADGLSVMHNPNAASPFPLQVFASGMVHRLVDGTNEHSVPGFHPYVSNTHVFKGKSADQAARAFADKMREKMATLFGE